MITELNGYCLSKMIYKVFSPLNIIALLFNLPAFAQSVDSTNYELLEEVLVLEENENVRSQLMQIDGMNIFAGKKTEVINLEGLVMNKGANTTRQLFSHITGVTIYENEDAGLQLSVGGRGLDPNRSSNYNVRQNGYEISADPLGYPESYYTPTSNGVSSIQVIRGAASLQYGSQFGGLLNFVMKEPKIGVPWSIESSSSIGSYGLRTNFNSISFRKGSVSGYSYYNIRSSKGFRANSELKANHSYSTLVYSPSSKLRISLEHTYLSYLAKQSGGLTDSQFTNDPFQSNRERNFFKVNWNMINGRFKYEINSATLISAKLTFLKASRQSIGFRGIPGLLNTNPISAIDELSTVDNSYVYPRDLISGQFNNQSFESKVLHRYLIKDHRSALSMGIKIYKSDNYSRQGAGSNGNGADFDFMDDTYVDYPNQSSFRFPNTNYALFLENVIFLSNNWSITPGARIEYIRTRSEGSYENLVYDNAGNVIFRESLTDSRNLPRSFALFGLGISHRSSKKAEFYANLSQNYRSVTFSDIRTVNPSFIIDPNISDEKGFTADMGIRMKKSRFSYDINTFSLLYASRIGIIFNDRAQRVRKNIGTALIYGIENYVSYDLIKASSIDELSIKIFSNLSLTDSRYLFSEIPNVTGKRVEFIPFVNWKSGANMSFKKWKLSSQITAVTSQYTDVENSDNALAGEPREGILGPIPGYKVCDLSMSYTRDRFEYVFGVNNLLNERYYTRRALGYPGPGILPSAPVNGFVNVKFTLEPKRSN